VQKPKRRGAIRALRVLGSSLHRSGRLRAKCRKREHQHGQSDRGHKAFIREVPKPKKDQKQYGYSRRNGSINQQSYPFRWLEN
jgi:hypothetical protein